MTLHYALIFPVMQTAFVLVFSLALATAAAAQSAVSGVVRDEVGGAVSVSLLASCRTPGGTGPPPRYIVHKRGGAAPIRYIVHYPQEPAAAGFRFGTSFT